MEADYSLPYSQQPTTSYPENINPAHYILAYSLILTLFSIYA